MQELTGPHGFPFLLPLSSVSQKMSQLKNLIAIIVSIQITLSLPMVGSDYWSISPANAILYSPDTKIPRTGELALRRAIPANTNMKAIQVDVTD